MKKSVTLAQIAEACCTSIGTVSRAINGKSDISEETRATILRTASEMGYRSEKIPEYGKVVTIALVYFKSFPFSYDEITDGIQSAVKKWQRAGIRVQSFQTDTPDQEEQIQLLNSLDLSKYDALVINSAGKQTGEFIYKLRQEGYPVATFNTDANNSNRLFFVGADAFGSGYLAAGLLSKLINGSGKVAIYGSFVGNETMKERMAGFYAVFEKEHPDIELIPVFNHSEDKKNIEKTIKTLLDKHPDLVGIVPANSRTTRATVNVLMELQRKDIHVVGFDLSPESRKALMNDYCDAILFQNPKRQGYLAVKLMAQYLLYGTLPTMEDATVSTDIITKYNLVWNATCG